MGCNGSIKKYGIVVNTKRKWLKPTAIPSLHLPKSTVTLEFPKKRRSPKKRDLPTSTNLNYSCETSTSVEIQEKVNLFLI